MTVQEIQTEQGTVYRAVFTDSTAEAARAKEQMERVKADIKNTPPKRAAVWGVHDCYGNVVETFHYKDRAGAEQSCAMLMSARRFDDEVFYITLVKERV